MKKPAIIHPYLISIFPMLALYAQNADKVQLGSVLVPTAFSFLATGLLVVTAKLVFRQPVKTGIIISLFVLLSLSYGIIYDGLRYTTTLVLGSNALAIRIVRHRYLIPADLLLCLAAAVYFLKSRRDFVLATRALNAGSLCLVSMSAVLIAISSFHRSPAPPDLSKNEILAGYQEPRSGKEMPDVYLITFDEFASLSTIRQTYGYDASPFEDFMRQKGFHIVPGSRSNYDKTEFSLFSLWNMEYVHKNRSLINHSRVGYLFSEMGYKVITSSSRMDVIRGLLKYSSDKFVSMLLMNNIGRVFETELQRLRVLTAFLDLNDMIKVQGPKFVYVHIPMPHIPFIFKSDGSPQSYDDRQNWNDPRVYLGQWQYALNRMKSLVDTILANSKTDPVIILESDHGVRKGMLSPEEFKNMGPEAITRLVETPEQRRCLKNAFSIFFAYHFPGEDGEVPYDTISSVNTFRVVFNRYFGTNYKILPDDSYLPLDDTWNNFVRVNEQLSR